MTTKSRRVAFFSLLNVSLVRTRHATRIVRIALHYWLHRRSAPTFPIFVLCSQVRFIGIDCGVAEPTIRCCSMAQQHFQAKTPSSHSRVRSCRHHNFLAPDKPPTTWMSGIGLLSAAASAAATARRGRKKRSRQAEGRNKESLDSRRWRRSRCSSSKMLLLLLQSMRIGRR